MPSSASRTSYPSLSRSSTIAQRTSGSIFDHENVGHSIFEPFHRTGASRETAAGVGLGLSVTQRIVVAHGGMIEVESAPDVGSTRATLRSKRDRGETHQRGEAVPLVLLGADPWMIEVAAVLSGSCSARGTCMTFPDPAGSGGCNASQVQCDGSYSLCGCGVTVMSGCNYPDGYAGGPTNGDRDCFRPGSTGGPGDDGGVDASTSNEAGEAGLPDGSGEEIVRPDACDIDRGLADTEGESCPAIDP